MKLSKLSVGSALIVFLALCHFEAWAGGNLLKHNASDPLNPIQVRWDERMMPIKWVLSRDGYPGSGISNTQLENELIAAFTTWESISTSNITFSYQGQVDRRTSEVDGYQLVTFTDPESEFAPGVVGLAQIFSFHEETVIDDSNNDLDGNGTQDLPNGTYPAGTIFDGNILFNSSVDLRASGTQGTLDIRAIALHEIGHFIGLSHSSIADTVMWPFINPDIEQSRQPAVDDVAYVSLFYPKEPEFSAVFGNISGKVTNGFDNNRILGAHVYAVDIESGEKLVGAYTGVDGSYVLPIHEGSYFVGIEPLDGDPIALDPQRINEIIASTFDTSFTEELFDANESNIESDPLAAIPVTVSAGSATADINIKTNTVNVPGVSRVLVPGINYFAYPVAVPEGLTAFDLIKVLGDETEINALERLNPQTQLFERVSYVDGIPGGINFSIRRGEGYLVHALKQKAVSFTGVPDCPRISLQTGLNLIGVPCPPSTYSAFDLLTNLGSMYEVLSVKRFNPLDPSSFQTAAYSASTPSGDDFYIANGEAYFVEMQVAKNDIRVPGNANLFPPAITGISPGRGVPGEFILVTGEGFDADIQKNIITFNGVGAPIIFSTPSTIAVSIPANATSGPVKVIANGRESNSVDFIIQPKNIQENSASTTPLLAGQVARGSLATENEQDRYSFLGAKGAVVTIRAETLSGADLLLALEGPSGVLLMSDDDSGGASNPVIRNFVLPEAGHYTAVVTSVAGTGAYDLFLEIRSTSSEPAVSVLQGDAQSALAGTDLPKPLEVFVTSGIGKPLAGVPVTFTATDVDVVAPSQGFALQNAGTTVITTNSNGIATIRATAPNASGVYDITVTVPGMEPVTMQVSATPTAVARAVISKQVEDCGGVGCPVNEKLPAPYVIQYFDSNDQPVENVLTSWKVVSGGGTLSDFSPAGNGRQVTGPDGRVEVFHTLGQKVFASLNGRPTKVPLMQAVAATVAGYDAPVLFSAISKAGAPAKMEGLNSNFSRLTYGTSGLNAIRLRVTDQFDNPVKGALIDAGDSDLEVAPGQLDSVPLQNYETNEDGIWIGAVKAFQVTPTLDEFGNAGAAGLAAPYNVVVSHPTAGSLSYIVDVDMGPEMVTQWGQSASALITKELEQPLAKIVMRYQRIDTFEDIGDGVDDDNGDWTDESFDRLRQIPIEGVAIQFTASRVDGFKEADSGLTATKINGQDEITLVTNAQGVAEATISLSEVGGAISVLGEIFTPIIAQLETDTGDALGAPVEYPLENYNRESTGILAVPVTVEVAMDAERASGIDWSTFVVSLNGTTTIFDGGADMFPPLNKFPNFFRLFIDGAELLEWPSAEVLASGEFSELKLVYQPLGSELVEGQNSLSINADIESFGSATTQLNEQEVFTFSNDVDDAQWALARVLNSAWELDFDLNKTTSLAQMQNRAVPATGVGALTIGDYEVFHIPLVEPSSLKVELLDSDKQLVETLFDEPSLPGVSHSFVLLQKDIDSRIVRMADKPDLHVRITSTSLANGQAREVLYRGELHYSTTGKMLGQVMQHDVLIQDGSLNLRREDLALQGAGPQLNFIRSYSNARSPENENGVFGTGWSHNHEIFAKVLAWSDGAPNFENNLPGWIAQTRLTAQPKLMTSMEFASILPDPANKSPSMIAISNGGVFERDANGNWIGQRGNHGSLGGSLASGYVYTSKDGTHYQFASATDPYGRFPVMVISDRNGNALTYTYEQIEINENLEGADFVFSPLEYKLTRVTDQAGRYLDFQYARGDNGFVRLTSVKAVVGGAASENIQLNFDYYKRKSSDTAEVANRFDVVGMLRQFSREDFTETYEYDRVQEDGLPNLVSVIDANGHKTAYQYHADVPVDFLSVAPGTVLTDLVQKVCYPTDLAANICTKDFAEFDYSLADGNQRVVKDLRANATTYTLNRWGNPAKVEEPEGKTTEFEWSIDRNEADNVMRFKRDVSMDAQWEYRYDAKGNLVLEIDPFGEETSQVWHPLFAVLESRTDKNGNQLERALDGQGNVLSETRTATVDGVPTSVTVTNRYSNLGGFKNLLEWTENGRGYRTTFTYDDNGNLESATQPADATTGAAIVTHYEFNNRGLKTKTIDPSGNATEWRYDSLDRLEWQIDAEGNTTQIAYDDKGNKDWEESVDRYFIGDTQHTRVLKLDYTYDARDRVTDIVRMGTLDGATLDTNGNPLIGGARTFAYDGNSNITSESDWFGRATTHKYDGLNRRSETTNREQKIMSYDYDFRSTAGSVLQKGLRKITTDYNGNPTTEYFDVLNRLYRVEHPTVYAHSTSGGAADAVNYVRTIEYDKLDNVLAVTDEDGNRTQYEYDGRYLKTAQINALSDRYTWHYDANGNLSRTIDEAGRETAYEYDAQDRLTTKSQPEGHIHRYVEYQPNGALKKEIDPWGFEYSYTYDKLNHKTSITHPDGQDILRHTKEGQLAYRKDAEDRAESNLYGPDSRLLVSTDARGRTTANSYDHNGNITNTVLAWDQATTGETRVATHTEYDLLDRKHKVHEAFGTSLERVTTYTYDNQSNLKQVHVPDENNPDGQVTSYIYDELNRVKTTVAPQTTNYAKAAATSDDLETQSLQRHNGAGKVVWLKDRRGNTTSTQYDALQRADVITDALGNSIDHEYDKVGNLRFIKDKRGNVRETVYDELNRVTHQYINMLTDPSAHTLEAGSTRQFRLLTNRYDTTGFAGQERVNEVVDAEDNTVISSLDWRGNVLTQTLPAGDNYPATTVVNTYDKSGWLTNSKTGELTETQNAYFADGTLQSLTRVQKIAGLDDEITNYQYDIFGNQALVIKPKQNQQTSTYDARNRLALVEDDLGNQTRFEYDLHNNLLRQYQSAANDSGEENLVEYIYDERNQKRAHIQHKADGNLTTLYDYDAAGNLAQQQDAKGQVFGYQYDVLNRLHIQNFPAGGDITSIVTTYDANGNLDVVTENKPGNVAEITDHDYDLLDRLESKNQRGHVVSYTYDNNGNRLTVTSPGGTTTNTFDTRNRLDSVTTASGTTVYTYLPTGWTDIVIHANGTKVDYDYDSIGRPLKILNRAANDDVLSQFDYQYDLNGNRTQQIEIQNGFANAAERTRVTDYVYDDLDRLESFTHTQGTSTESHTYTYYPSYDRKTETVVKDGATLKSRTFTYDETNWIKTITEAAGPGGLITYTYDNNGNSTAKTDTTGEGPASTLFTYNSRNQLVGVAAGNAGSEVGKGAYHYNYQSMRIRHLGSARGDIEYVYDDKSIIDELSNSTTTQVAHYSYGDRLLSLTSGGAEQFYHYAALGTTANLTNTSGQNQIAYRLDPFGEITQQEGTSLNRQVFTGHEHDTETGLIYMKARFYDPAVGRFINQDTYLGESTTPPSLHRYLYAYGNPTVYVDPDGHAAYLASGQEFDDFGYQLYSEGKHVQAAGVAVLSSFYRVGTGFFTLGLFDEANQAITDNDTASGAAKQFGSGVANTAKEVAQEYATEGVIAGTAGVAAKAGCGRWKQACDQMLESGQKVYEKLNTDIWKAKEKTDASLTGESPNINAGNEHAKTDIGNSAGIDDGSIVFIDSTGLAIKGQKNSLYRGISLDSNELQVVKERGLLSGKERGAETYTEAFPESAPNMARVLQYVDARPFPKDSDFVGLKRIPHDALDTGAAVGARYNKPLNLFEVSPEGLNLIDVEDIYRKLGFNLVPDGTTSGVIGEVISDGSVPAKNIRTIYEGLE